MYCINIQGKDCLCETEIDERIEAVETQIDTVIKKLALLKLVKKTKEIKLVLPPRFALYR